MDSSKFKRKLPSLAESLGPFHKINKSFMVIVPFGLFLFYMAKLDINNQENANFKESLKRGDYAIKYPSRLEVIAREKQQQQQFEASKFAAAASK